MNNFKYFLLFCLSIHISFTYQEIYEYNNLFAPTYKRILKQHIVDDYAFFMMQFYSGNLLELVKSGKDLPKRVLLAGPCGMHKENLACYLAKRYRTYTYAYDFFFSNLKECIIRSFDQLFQDYFSAIVISIDELNKSENTEIKEHCYNALDRLQTSENLLIVATVSDEKIILSDNIKKYFTHIYTIDRFDDNSRLKVFKYFFNNFELNSDQEKYFLSKTIGYSLGDIESMFSSVYFNKKVGNNSDFALNIAHYILEKFFKGFEPKKTKENNDTAVPVESLRFKKKDNHYSCFDFSNSSIELGHLASFLDSDLGGGDSSHFKKFIAAPRFELAGSNYAHFEKEGDYIFIGCDSDDSEPTLKIHINELLKILDVWDFFCKEGPEEIVITKINETFTIDAKD